MLSITTVCRSGLILILLPGMLCRSNMYKPSMLKQVQCIYKSYSTKPKQLLHDKNKQDYISEVRIKGEKPICVYSMLLPSASSRPQMGGAVMSHAPDHFILLIAATVCSPNGVMARIQSAATI